MRFRLIALSLTAALAWVTPGTAQTADGIAGSYLAARHASMFSDYEAAAEYYTRALVRDPSNARLLENATTAFMGLGDIDRASQVARRLRTVEPDSQVAGLALMAYEIGRDDYDGLLADIDAGQSVGPLVDGLVRGWSLLGKGDATESFAAFDAVINEQGLSVFGNYHKGLALGSVGDFEGAAEALQANDGIAFRGSRRGLVAYVEVLSQLGRNDEATGVVADALGPDPDPRLEDLVTRLQSGDPLPFNSVRSPRDGMAEVFFSVATALNTEASDAYTLLYSRIAEYLRPDHIDAILLSAGLLETLGRYELAVETYNQVPSDDPAYYAAEIGRAEALRRSGDTDASIEALTQLARTHGDLPVVHVTLGDTLRQLDRFEEASRSYDRAIALYPNPERDQWIVFFARGITHEREGRWALAEADFRMALDLNPGQPQVLNYLGYSLVERQENLDEALEMIEQAVAARPDSGYITDSLGWVLYRLGRYQEAVAHMERAAALEPVDPIVNDHLGDVYWAVGRKLEAEFQWKRALSFGPEPDEADRIRRKLEVGLDQVLIEEGGDPINVANEDG